MRRACAVPGTPAWAYGQMVLALKVGTVSRPTACAVCGKPQEYSPKGRPSVVYHHHSYAPEHALAVVAVCHKDHAAIHRGDILEPLTGERHVGHGRRGSFFPRGVASRAKEIIKYGPLWTPPNLQATP